MTERRRKWLQVHLSTALVLMFAAGALIWMNIPVNHMNALTDKDYGWPSNAVSVNGVLSAEEGEWDCSSFGVVIDVSVAFLILIVVWFICEWWVRLREIGYVHSGTGIALAVATAGLFWANVMPRVIEILGSYGQVPFSCYGWPLVVMIQLPACDKSVAFLGNECVDIAVAMAILFDVWFVCEWWIRRRTTLKKGVVSAILP